MRESIEHLREVISSATPGLWYIDEDGTIYSELFANLLPTVTNPEPGQQKIIYNVVALDYEDDDYPYLHLTPNDAQAIVHFQPQNIRDLLDEMTALKTEITTLQEALGSDCFSCKGKGYYQHDDGTCSCSPASCSLCRGTGKTSNIEKSIRQREIEAARAGSKNFVDKFLERLGYKYHWTDTYTWKQITETLQEEKDALDPLKMDTIFL